MIKPKIFISKCLWFESCRYNGQIIRDIFIEKIKQYCEVITSCPEVEIWLSIPRKPIRLVYKNNKINLVEPSTNTDLTTKMDNFSDNFIWHIDCLDWAIMQHRSPSCGPNSVKIYDKPGKHIPGVGIFANKVMQKFPHIVIEDEKRLLNYKIRDKWLIVTWTLARFRKINKDRKIKDLILFHSQHKYLFMLYSYKILKEMWNLVASYDKKNIDFVYDKYFELMSELLKNSVTKWTTKNVLQHIFWYFKDDITQDQKDFFVKSMDMFFASKLPSSTLFWMLRDWAIKYDEEYINSQYIFEPYPYELLDLKDSGKYINI